MLTVSDFLHLEPFKDFKVVSGSTGLTNKISSVNIMDNPDALDWFSPEEMLISSGFFSKMTKSCKIKLLDSLKPSIVLR